MVEKSLTIVLELPKTVSSMDFKGKGIRLNEKEDSLLFLIEYSNDRFRLRIRKNPTPEGVLWSFSFDRLDVSHHI